jgi:hypothetical protein
MCARRKPDDHDLVRGGRVPVRMTSRIVDLQELRTAT